MKIKGIPESDYPRITVKLPEICTDCDGINYFSCGRTNCWLDDYLFGSD